MKQPVISDLSNVTQEMIDALKVWLENIKNGKWKAGSVCPFYCTPSGHCYPLFVNLGSDSCKNCPCSIYGEEATILAFTIICDVWKVYHKEDT